MSAIDLMMNRYVQCPHCDHKMWEPWEYNLAADETVTVDCMECGEVFETLCEVHVTYTTSKLPPVKEPA